ncbi:MAG: hypothetical protein IPP96_15045 [Chitinophagaceae bacterium]|nr:hypothetical protein [Chitinophagaceae bacterium]
MKKIISPVAILLLCSSAATAQVPVSKEPRHKKVIENKYIRLLDVRIKPGDTTQFHIHATPSLFLYFTNTTVCSQIKGKDWVTAKNQAGNASYRSFDNDTLVHRVSNCDTVPFHVTDIELLSAYKPNDPIQPLPLMVLFDNGKAIAYRITRSSLNKEIISNHGPMIAELVAGDDVTCYDTMTKRSTTIKNGKYLYIEPGRSFYFSAKENEEINMVLFEIK